MFSLHPQLSADTHQVTDLTLCRVLMSKDANYPWFLLVPKRDGIREIYELEKSEQNQLLHESTLLSRALMDHFEGHKLNVATLGNMVPQLHIHHIVRFKEDLAWPKPVWGQVPAKAFSDDEAQQRIAAIAARLKA
ncbi:HIT domain-containing protein [Gallaecimonas mangrovi]|uniref:HIT domain-containing protein n=1 Tax=Gallaecimonas mangrovi TaxID=2291597 RepID=UPI000E206CBE|nr:HIT family protein [Gallaecimonas mangrovi]